ncbi:MAG: lysophospholipid acyltransferase family protein [Bacillota bacterium]
MMTGWGRVLLRLSSAAVRFFAQLEVEGSHRIPPSGPVIICPNHLSVIDPLLLISCLDRELVFWAASYLFDIPLLGWILRQGEVMPVQGVRQSMRAVRTTCRVLEAGRAVVMFPQGGVRSPGERVMPHRGAAFVATRTGAPLIPAAIFGSDRVLPVGRYLPRRGRVRLRFGEPLTGFREVSTLNAALARSTEALLEDTS